MMSGAYAGQLSRVQPRIYFIIQATILETLASVPRLDMKRDESLHSIAGTPPDLYSTWMPSMTSCDHNSKKDYMPEFIQHSSTHCSRCWLNHPMAKATKEVNFNGEPLISVRNLKSTLMSEKGNIKGRWY